MIDNVSTPAIGVTDVRQRYRKACAPTATQWFTFAWASVLGLTGCNLLGIAFSVVPKTGRGASAVATPIGLVLSVLFFRWTPRGSN